MTDKKLIDQSLTSAEVTETLNAIKGDSHCPFCGSETLLIDTTFVGTSFSQNPGFRPILGDMGKVRYMKKDDSDEPPLWYRETEQQATPMIRAVCQNCGCSLFFDYKIVEFKHSKLVEKNGSRNK